jgi:Ni,Fe-hydrogenase III large subunit
MNHITNYTSFVNETFSKPNSDVINEAEVSNSEILDVIDSIQNLIKNIKKDSSKKSPKLFTAASPLVKELLKLVESAQESLEISAQVPAETIAIQEVLGTDAEAIADILLN